MTRRRLDIPTQAARLQLQQQFASTILAADAPREWCADHFHCTRQTLHSWMNGLTVTSEPEKMRRLIAAFRLGLHLKLLPLPDAHRGAFAHVMSSLIRMGKQPPEKLAEWMSTE